MHSTVVFIVVPFLPDGHRGPLIARRTREGVGHMYVCAIDQCRPNPRSIATSASRLFSNVERTENASDFVFCLHSVVVLSKNIYFALNATTNSAFFCCGRKKITHLKTHIHVSPYCAILFFPPSFLKNREKRYMLRNLVGFTAPLC